MHYLIVFTFDSDNDVTATQNLLRNSCGKGDVNHPTPQRIALKTTRALLPKFWHHINNGRSPKSNLYYCWKSKTNPYNYALLRIKLLIINSNWPIKHITDFCNNSNIDLPMKNVNIFPGYFIFEMVYHGCNITCFKYVITKLRSHNFIPYYRHLH